MIFLVEAAIAYLIYTDKNQGNKLERSVFCKLQDPTIMACAKADALMHHHIFADLVTLAKSKDLKKSALDMQLHYLELKIFLDELESNPEIIADRELKVFVSEKVLYTAEHKLNHRSHHSYQCIQDAIFKNILDNDKLLSCIKNGAVMMKEKLLSYGRDQLPGGRYWNPDDAETIDALKHLEPSNDLCESMLGLNDYLCTALPNMQQLTRSNLVEIKKNHTMTRFNSLPPEKQEFMVNLAIKNRKEVKDQYKQDQHKQEERRQENIVKQKEERDNKKKKVAMEKEKLSKLYLVTSVSGFDQVLASIGESCKSNKKRRASILAFLKEQVRIRKTLLSQKSNIFLQVKANRSHLMH